MAKRGATEQITKDTWERDEDQGSRDRSEEPAEVASQAVLAKRKILKPRSRVSGASSIAPSPASTSLFNFGQPAASTSASAPSTSSLFGQPQASPSKNLFGQATTPVASTSSLFGASTAQKTPFGSLFGASTQAKDSAAPSNPLAVASRPAATSLFGSPAVQPSAVAKQPTSLFGTPPSQSPQVAKAGQSIFASPAQTPNGTSLFNPQKSPAEPQQSLFGLPSAKIQDVPEITRISTTPTATPVKASVFNMFSGGSSSTSNLELNSSNVANKSAPSKPLFGSPGQPAGSAPRNDKDLNETPNFFSTSKAPKTNNLFGQSGVPSNSKPLFSSSSSSSSSSTSLLPSPSKNVATAPVPDIPKVASNGTGRFESATNHVPETKGIKIDPHSLEPPAGSNLTREQMPNFNWLYQIRCLNHQYLEQIQRALSEDPYSDLSSWSEFYQKQLSNFDSQRLAQKDQLENGMHVDAGSQAQKRDEQEITTPSKASRIFESALAPSLKGPSNPQPPSNAQTSNAGNISSTSSLFQTTPSTGLFGQPSITQAATGISNASISTESIFSSTAQKSASLFGSKPSSDTEPKASVPFQFGSGGQGPSAGSIFDSNPTKESDSLGVKPFVANSFSWNNNSAVASNASSPGSVLAGGTAGMKDVDTGGWSNPFTQENPLFITNNDDDDDEEEGGEEGDGDDRSAGDSVRPPNENTNNVVNPSSAPKPESTPSIFAPQQSTASSLFGRVTSTPTFNFGQSSIPKTGAVGLFGSTPSSNDNKTWTPDRGIKFGDQSENKTNSAPSLNAPASSLFGTSTGLFGGSGSNANVPSFNFAQPTNGNSLFSNPSSKAATPPSLLGGQSSGGLAPPTSLFGGPSPAPSDMSTPGETSNKEGGEDENEPSDDAGQGGGNVRDLSGRGPGEEDEDEIFEARSSIYNLNKGDYVKIGIGRLRVLKNRITSKSRIVVKVETGKVLMNVGLRKELDYAKVTESEAQRKVVKVLEILPGGQSRVWVMKVSEVEIAQKLRKLLEENK
ncbi:hypothetical protein ABW20_dc0105082 [Dactylellina cionopaga]|nr:hypothetical protein ABW20_dc0105082 [Dactylellina cionopaga]